MGHEVREVYRTQGLKKKERELITETIPSYLAGEEREA